MNGSKVKVPHKRTVYPPPSLSPYLLSRAPSLALVWPPKGPWCTAHVYLTTPSEWEDTLPPTGRSCHRSTAACTPLMRADSCPSRAAHTGVAVLSPAAARHTVRLHCLCTRAAGGTQAILALSFHVGAIGVCGCRAPRLAKVGRGTAGVGHATVVEGEDARMVR